VSCRVSARRHLGLRWGGSEILDPGKGETDCLGEVSVGEPTEPVRLQSIGQEDEFGGEQRPCFPECWR